MQRQAAASANSTARLPVCRHCRERRGLGAVVMGAGLVGGRNREAMYPDKSRFVNFIYQNYNSKQ